MTNEIDRERLVPEKDKTLLGLVISSFTFIFLWFCAMEFLSIFDAFVFFVMVLCIALGAFRGGVKEFFGFFGTLAALILAISGYRFIFEATRFDFGTGNDVWGEIGWFLILLAVGWGVCFWLKHYLQKKMEKMANLRVFNSLVGVVIAFLKGIIFGYVFFIVVMMTGISHRTVFLERDFQSSYLYPIVDRLEKRYRIVENLSKMELAQKMYATHERIRMQKIAADLFPEDAELQKKTAEFLMWLALKPARLQNLPASKEAQKQYEEFMKIPQARELCEIELQKLKNQKEITIFDLCEILRKPSIIGLLNHPSVLQIVKLASIENIQAEVDPQ